MLLEQEEKQLSGLGWRRGAARKGARKFVRVGNACPYRLVPMKTGSAPGGTC